MNTPLTVILAVLLFGIVIFLHEFGHFITAKLFHIKVNEFAIGMGPKLLSFGKGETKYSLRLLPIGGFCAMEGEDGESTDERAFGRQKVWKRIIVVSAGALMNLLLGFILMLTLQAQEENFLSTEIAGVGNAITVESGYELKPGDRITSINGYLILDDYDVNYALSRYGSEPMTFEILRAGEKMTVPNVKIDFEKLTGKDDGYAFYVNAVEKNVFTVIGQAGRYVVSFGRVVWAGLIDLISGQYGLDAVSGPIGTAEVIGQAAASGSNFIESLNNLLWIMALITVNLGIFNLLPVPALDGGRLLFLLIEAIRRKPVPAKYEGWVHAAGFVLLIGFMIVVTFNDIGRLIFK